MMHMAVLAGATLVLSAVAVSYTHLADAVIVFTRHYLDHVYVVEKRMSKIDFPKSGRRVMKPKAEVSIPIALPPPEG